MPDGYCELLAVDLQKNKKLAVLINVLCLLVAALLVIPALFIVSIRTLFDLSDFGLYVSKFVVLIVGLVVYIILHELVHGIFMRVLSGIRPNYGFNGLYAYAGSRAYFNKISYIVIALAPVVIWGIVLAIVLVFIPESWFWVVYLIQVANISGAVGDLYVTVRFLFLPKDILVQDSGVSMTVFSHSDSSF